MGTSGRRILLRWYQFAFAYLVLVQTARDQGELPSKSFAGLWLISKDRTFGEIDILFENRITARKFKYTKADRKSTRVEVILRRANLARIRRCRTH